MKLIKNLIFAGFILSPIYILYAHHLIRHTANQMTPPNIPYLIVLGAKVDRKTMSRSLFNRAKMALAYLQDNPSTKAVLTGGQGPGEDITEAVSVKNYLKDQGIAEERLLLEERSTSTFDNIAYAKQLYAEVEEAVIVSNDFHLFRSIQNAKKLGIKGYPLAAETPKVVKTKLFIREYAAIAWLFLSGK